MSEDIAYLSQLMKLLVMALDCQIIMSEKPRTGEDGIDSRELVYIKSGELYPGEVSMIGQNLGDKGYIGLIIPVSILDPLE